MNRKIFGWHLCGFLLCMLFLAACSNNDQGYSEYLESGEKYTQSGDYESAKLAFNNALKIKKDSVEALFGLAKVIEREKNWYQLERYLNRVIDLEPSHVDARVLLTNLYLGANRLDEAILQTNYLRQNYPDDSRSKLLNAAVLFATGNRVEARELAEEVYRDEPGNISAIVQIAKDEIALGSKLGALDYLNAGLAGQPDNLVLNLVKLKLLASEGDLEQSIPIFQRLITLYPASRKLPEMLARLYYDHGKTDEAVSTLERFAFETRDLSMFYLVIEMLGARQGIEKAESKLRDYIEQFPKMLELRFALVDIYLKSRRAEEAKQLLMSILASTSEGSTSYLTAKNRLAKLAFVTEELNQAESLVGEVLKVDPKNQSAIAIMSNIHLVRGELEPAIRLLRLGLRYNPDSAEILISLAKAHEMENNVELANEYYARAVDVSNQGPLETTEYAEFLVKTGQLPLANQYLKYLVDRRLANEKALQLYAHVSLQNGDWESAEDIARTLETMGGNADAVAHIRGMALLGKDEADEAIDTFIEFQAMAPDASRPLAVLIDTYIKVGKIDEAKLFLQNTVKQNPNNSFAFLLMGSVAVMEKNWDLAQASFEKVLDLQAINKPATINLAKVLLQKNDAAQAESVVTTALAASPNDLGLNMLLAGIYQRQSEPDKAIGIYEKLLRVDSTTDVVANNLAALLLKSDKAEDSARALSVASRFDGTQIPHFQDTLGWAYLKNGEAGKAVSYLQSAAAGLPESGEVKYHLAKAYAENQQPELAQRLINEILQIDSVDRDWYRAAKALEQSLQ